jgi:hypothetical protein
MAPPRHPARTPPRIDPPVSSVVGDYPNGIDDLGMGTDPAKCSMRNGHPVIFFWPVQTLSDVELHSFFLLFRS